MHVPEKPRVYGSQFPDLFHAPAAAEGFPYIEKPEAVRPLQFSAQDSIGKSGIFKVLAIRSKPGPAYFKRTQGFLKGLLESLSYAHSLAYGFHLCGKSTVGSGELFKGEARYFSYHIIYSRLKTGRRLAGYVVAYFVKRISHRELCGYFRYREPCGL